MNKAGPGPPPYAGGAAYSTYVPPPAAPPSYSQAVGGVPPSSPFIPPTQSNDVIITNFHCKYSIIALSEYLCNIYLQELELLLE
ncbi:Protein of unknown function, partial [Gryllus bimaculatus]